MQERPPPPVYNSVHEPSCPCSLLGLYAGGRGPHFCRRRGPVRAGALSRLLDSVRRRRGQEHSVSEGPRSAAHGCTPVGQLVRFGLPDIACAPCCAVLCCVSAKPCEGHHHTAGTDQYGTEPGGAWLNCGLHAMPWCGPPAALARAADAVPPTSCSPHASRTQCLTTCAACQPARCVTSFGPRNVRTARRSRRSPAPCDVARRRSEWAVGETGYSLRHVTPDAHAGWVWSLVVGPCGQVLFSGSGECGMKGGDCWSWGPADRSCSAVR
eukprot:352805-Chlamydomonas_euryale.AAC.1